MVPVDYAVVVLYFVVVLGLGFWYRRRAAENLEAYFLGGKRLSWITLAMSGAVSNFDITGTMWMVSMLVLLGMRSWWHHWMWGVMLPAFALGYMAKWVRRSRVITGAEWMVTRFGRGHGGRVARLAYAVMAVITMATFIGYAFQGIGKFAAVYIPLETLGDWMESASVAPFAQELFTTYEAQTLATVIFSLTTLYVVLGGLYGVVITDVIQTVILTFAGILIAGIAFVNIDPATVESIVPTGWDELLPTWRMEKFAGHPDSAIAGYEMFGALVMVWVLKGFLMNAGGPAQMYDFQRYLATRTPRDAAKTAAAWPFFLIVRWGMVMGITLLAMSGFNDVTDKEQVMPMVLKEYLRPGLRGLVVAGLLAAFMSTFSSTVNSAASYIVRDLWGPLFSGEADERKQVKRSYIATVGIVVVGILIGFQAKSIKQIWDWMMMALGSGVIIPNVLRWYWWRFNGWGYAAGTFGGIALSMLRLFMPDVPYYVLVPVICLGSLTASVVVSVLTQPTDRDVLISFFRSVRPFGVWGDIRRRAFDMDAEDGSSHESAWRAVFNTVVACIGITGLYVFTMYLVGHWYTRAIAWSGVGVVSIIILYFTWYRHLPAAGEEAG